MRVRLEREILIHVVPWLAETVSVSTIARLRFVSVRVRPRSMRHESYAARTELIFTTRNGERFQRDGILLTGRLHKVVAVKSVSNWSRYESIPFNFTLMWSKGSNVFFWVDGRCCFVVQRCQGGTISLKLEDKNLKCLQV